MMFYAFKVYVWESPGLIPAIVASERMFAVCKSVKDVCQFGRLREQNYTSSGS